MKTKVISRSWKVLVLSFFLGCVVSAGLSSAATTIDFGIDAQHGNNPPGNFTWDGVSLSITGIEVDAVSVLEIPGSALKLSGGFLDLEDLQYTGFNNVPGYDLYFFGQGGTITIYADSSTDMFDNPSTYPDYSQNLMEGNWNGLVAVFPTGNSLDNPSPFILGGTAIDYKNNKLLYNLGLLGAYTPPEQLVGPFLGEINLRFIWDDELENFRVASGDVTNVVPIPGAIVLLGGGLLGLIGIRRRLSR